MRALEATNLRKSFGKLEIIHGISLHVEQGEIVGFIGPNGAGKTTTLKMLVNLIWPDSGEVSICGYDLFREREQALANLAGIIENPGLYPALTGMDHLRFIQRLRKVSGARLKECCEMSELGDWLKRPVRKYSLGMKQRLAIAMAILTKPPLLILDEPTNGLDPTAVMELRELMAVLSAQENVSILFSSHQLGEVEKLADRVLYIKHGVLLTEVVQQEQLPQYVLTVSDSAKALALVQACSAVVHAELLQEGQLALALPEDALTEALALLIENDIMLTRIDKQKLDLEYVYNRIFRSE